jgi:hypothetical protein
VGIDSLPQIVPLDAPRATTPEKRVVTLTAYGRSTERTQVEVTLHVVGGRPYELDIWDGTSVETRGRMPDPATLTFDE